ncbi:hypothetical protein [Aridibaculum aurantiacum]|uniref:hypothetical protein n=1 Tax=Aridibaculum aurantiacum TaxID=2810307 RepID=UPI001A95A8BE|nr:hypothetical protein [Aridibaculum aurantiacum]
MKKLLMIATVALLSTGAAFACDGDKKACCKKEEKKECCKKGDKKECHKKEDKKATKPAA